ncbi:MAG: DUF2142 domain-containing protein [Actinomycetota bacterium]|nr:DUF2142 domain-containing protein [Actinomycetota bacterium]
MQPPQRRRRILGIAVPTVAFLVLGWSWAFASPVGSSADEAYHLTSIWCAWGDSDTCTHTPTTSVVKVPDRIANASCMAQLGNESAACVYSLTEEQAQSVTVNVGNYPPVFYAVMRAFVGPDISKSVLLMRFLNVAIAAALLALALWVANPIARRALALAWMVCLVPTGVFFIASVNPSAWAITGGALFWVFLYTLLTQESFRSRRSLLAAGGALACAFIALSARGDSAIVLLASAVAVVLMAWPHLRGRVNLLWLSLLAIPLIAVAALFNVGRYASLNLVFPPGNPDMDQPNSVVKMLVELPTFLSGILGGQVSYWAQRTSGNDSQIPGFSWSGYSYGVGSLDVHNPELSSLLVLACVGGVLLLGFRSHSWRKVIALALLSATLVVELVFMRGLVAFQPVQSLQPRYYFALVVVIVSIAAMTFPRRPGAVNKGQAALLVVTLTVADTVALMATVARYTYGQAHSWTGIADPPSWWWASGPSPIVTMVIGALASLAWLSAMAWTAVDAGGRSPKESAVLRGKEHRAGHPHQADDLQREH